MFLRKVWGFYIQELFVFDFFQKDQQLALKVNEQRMHQGLSQMELFVVEDVDEVKIERNDRDVSVVD